MHSFTHTLRPNSPPQPVPPARAHTVTRSRKAIPMVPNDDDDDICPVCDGACTCRADALALSPSHGSAHPRVQPLKIRFTVPNDIRARLPAHMSPPSDSPVMLPGAESGGRTIDSPDSAVARTTARKDRRAKTSPYGDVAAQPRARAPRLAKNGMHPAGAGRTRSDKRIATNPTFVLLDDICEEGSTSDAFPTFVSAASSGEGSEATSADDSSDLDSGDDSDIQAEEERYIIAEENIAKEKARVRRELLGDNQRLHRRQRDRYKWQLIPRKKRRAVSADGALQLNADSDADDDDDGDAAEGAGEPAEDEPEDADVFARAERAERRRYSSKSEDDEDAFDAAVFFASLTSDGEGRGGSGSDDDTTSELGAQSLDESARAGLLDRLDGAIAAANGSTDLLPFVTQDIDGHLVFSCDTHLDLQMELAAMSTFTEPDHAGTKDQAMDIDSGLEREPPGNEDDGELVDEEWLDGAFTDGGDTTDDMLNEDFVPTVRGVMPMRRPMPPVTAVDPLSTVSSPRQRRRRQRRRSSATPSDIISRVRSRSRSASDAGSSFSLSVAPRAPAMGLFASSDPAGARIAIIDGSKKEIPSPFPHRIRRLRSASRTGSLVQSPRIEMELNEDIMSALAIESANSPEIIDLNDVLDAALLEPEPERISPGSASESDACDAQRHLRNLTRWDRIPMSTFRHTRAPDAGTPASPQPALGLGLGLGSVLRASARGATLAQWWDADRRAAAALSPVMFPVRDGERTPTGSADKRLPHHPPHYGGSPGKTHRDKERRRKKSRTEAGRRPSHVQRASSLVPIPPLRL